MTKQEAADLLGIMPNVNLNDVLKAYRQQTAKFHPDQGGTNSQFVLLQKARDTMLGSVPTDDDEVERLRRELEISQAQAEYDRIEMAHQAHVVRMTRPDYQQEQQAPPKPQGIFGHIRHHSARAVNYVKPVYVHTGRLTREAIAAKKDAKKWGKAVLAWVGAGAVTIAIGMGLSTVASLAMGFIATIMAIVIMWFIMKLVFRSWWADMTYVHHRHDYDERRR